MLPAHQSALVVRMHVFFGVLVIFISFGRVARGDPSAMAEIHIDIDIHGMIYLMRLTHGESKKFHKLGEQKHQERWDSTQCNPDFIQVT